jgi:predicted O-methyltransferase YrrM
MKLTHITNRHTSLPIYLNKNNLVHAGAEIGVRYGKNAGRILQKWEGETLFLIDTWPNIQIKNLAIERLDIYKNRCKFIHSSSVNASKQFNNESLDFCYIDASHKYNNVKLDIKNWWCKVKPGGILCGHDYSINEKLWLHKNPDRKTWPNKGTKKAVDEFVDENNLKIHIDIMKDAQPTSWYIKK